VESLETSRKSLELSIPVEEVAQETERAISSIQKKVKLPGFRPGKAPASIIRQRFDDDIRQDVLKVLIPKHFYKRAEDEGLRVVGTPDISEVHFHAGEPLRFKAEFEVAPEFEIGEYKDLTVPYEEPQVTDEDISSRLEAIREQKAEYVNIDPRPVEDGDYAVVALESLTGIDGPPVKQDELILHIGDPDTLSGFSENLRGLTPGEEKDFEVAYPEDHGQPKLAGKTVRFHARLTALRRKELPEMNDEFARDLGDYQSLDEVKEAIRRTIFAERQYAAQQEAQIKLLDQLVAAHDFPVPEAFIDRQIETQVERQLHALAAEGIDPRSIKLDWEKLKAAQRDKAIHDVKASLLLEKVADKESVYATNDEVDREVNRIARQEREPVAAVRKKLEGDGSLRRIAGNIRTEKTLNFLFEHARKTASEAPAE
jgi:trigger factor